MPAINLYHMDMSPTSRAIRMLAQALNVELNLITVNTMAGDQMAPEYIKVRKEEDLLAMLLSVAYHCDWLSDNINR